MLISASRRTDIPACYPQWFLRRMREGFVLAPNPRNPRQLSRISLSKEEAEGIVFWTKNPLPLLPYLDELKDFGIPFGFQFTITPYDRDIEPNLPDKEALIKAFCGLSERLGPKKMVWRYDPVILSADWTVKRHLKAFSEMAKRLQGHTGRCVFSLMDWYRKLSPAGKALAEHGWTDEEIKDVAEGFSSIARDRGMALSACCEAPKFDRWGVTREACISEGFAEAVIGAPVCGRKDPGQRASCGCIQSADIGVYDSCTNGCLYCYANTSRQVILQNTANHHPDSPTLIGYPEPEATVVPRKLPSIKAAQMKFPFNNKE
ncbi:MAG: hypothetical protein DBY45_05425 [Clostridiales bacterium]|nr:MAG: hypothetical protein DBY45_05425 [Clostridiales bacterium]